MLLFLIFGVCGVVMFVGFFFIFYFLEDGILFLERNLIFFLVVGVILCMFVIVIVVLLFLIEKEEEDEKWNEKFLMVRCKLIKIVFWMIKEDMNDINKIVFFVVIVEYNEKMKNFCF